MDIPGNGLKGPDNRLKFTGFEQKSRQRPMLFLLDA